MRPPEITSETEEGFQDLVFALSHKGGKAGSGEILRATGNHGGGTVSFVVRLGAEWKERRLADVNLTTYQGTVVIGSVGAESDAFVRVLDELYQTKLAPRKMNPETTFTAISLAGNPQKLDSGAVQLKLFFEASEEDRYAEAYLNIDAAKSRIYLREKDPEYRPPMILALGQGTKSPPHRPLPASPP